MDRLQFKARNYRSPKEAKNKQKSKTFYDKSCPNCGYRNKSNIGQKETTCLHCWEIY